MNEVQQQKVRRSRISLILLVVIFILPIVLAWVVSKNKALQPAQTKNAGTLFQPVRPVSEFTLSTIAREKFTLEGLQHKWTLVYFADTTCHERCRDSLTKVRDARYAMSGDATRIQYLLVYSMQPTAAEIQTLQEQHPRLIMLTADAEANKKLLDTFRLDGEGPLTQLNRVYLIDPIGNLMMYYPDRFPGNGLLKDLRHLLKWSQIG